MNKSRCFNKIITNHDGTVTKRSKQHSKLIAEYNWYQNLPDAFKEYVPTVSGLNIADFYSDYTQYTMQKIELPTMRDYVLDENTKPEVFHGFLDCVEDLFKKMKIYGKKNDFMHSMYIKTKNRIESMLESPSTYHYIDFEKVCYFLEAFENAVKDKEDIPVLCHGDFCFSNLFYDHENKKIMMIDPRGEMFGSLYYEMAKLMHSAVFNYDFIDTEQFRKLKAREHNPCAFHFSCLTNKFGLDVDYLMIICASLFISMIPLHSEHKQAQIEFYNVFEYIFDKYLETDYPRDFE